MAFFDAVDEKSGHRMFISGLNLSMSDFDQAHGQDPGSRITRLEAVDNPMELPGLHKITEDAVADVAPHPRYAHLGGSAIADFISQSE